MNEDKIKSALRALGKAPINFQNHIEYILANMPAPKNIEKKKFSGATCTAA